MLRTLKHMNYYFICFDYKHLLNIHLHGIISLHDGCMKKTSTFNEINYNLYPQGLVLDYQVDAFLSFFMFNNLKLHNLCKAQLNICTNISFDAKNSNWSTFHPLLIFSAIWLMHSARLLFCCVLFMLYCLEEGMRT